MLCGCIDIGSNTTRVLVAEARDGRLRELLQRRAFTRIGKGLKPGAEIPRAKIEEVGAVVADHRLLAEHVGAQHVRAVATAAIRGAANRDEFVTVVSERGGVEVTILDGQEEARLAFLGATRTLGRELDGTVGVVDVGGGSTELVVGTARAGVTWSISLPVGSSSATDAELSHDPPSKEELARLRGRLAKLFGDVEAPRLSRAYAVGGSATTLQRLVGTVLQRESLMLGLQQLVALPAAEIAGRLDMHAERVRLLPAAILLLDAASHAFRAPLQMGGGGLREGVVLEQLAQVGRT